MTSSSHCLCASLSASLSHPLSVLLSLTYSHFLLNALALSAEHWTFALEMMAEYYPEEVDLKLLGYMGLAKAHELQLQPDQMLENYTAAVELAAHSEDSAVPAHAHAGMARAAAMIGDKQIASSSAELQLDFAADDSQIILSGLTLRGELQISEGWSL